MHKLILSGGIAALTLVSAGAFAADTTDATKAAPSDKQNMVQQGNWLGTIAGSVSTTNSVTTTTTALTGGYMVTNNIGVGLKIAYNAVQSNNNFTGFAAARYYFDPQPNKTWVPFIGPFVGYNKPSGGTNSTIYGGNIGLDYFVAPNVSLEPTANYFHTTGSGFSTNTWSFAFGLTFWFAGK